MKKAANRRPIRPDTDSMLRAFLAPRCRDGAYRKQLELVFGELLQNPCLVNLKRLGVRFGVMLFGGRLTQAVLSDRIVVRTGVYADAENAGADVLYHFAPTDCVEKILACGLLPKKHYVFLTDMPQLLGQTYLPWKTSQTGRETYTLLKINVRQLSKVQPVYGTDRSHEYVTGKIGAEYISVVADDPE